jgi:cell division protein FtsL
MTGPAAAPAQAGRAAERQAAGAHPRLRVLRPQALARRTRRRRARLILGLAACIVASALLVVAAGGAVVVSEQLRLDAVRTQVQTALAQDQSLQVQKAELQSPSRILSIAEHRLGMVAPTTVHYLAPSSAPSQVAGSQATHPAATSPPTRSSIPPPRR